MNTTQLECFVQVASSLSFRGAADELHLSQPTVSKQIAALEHELGGKLFVRSTREVLLTALGESFLRDAQEILRLTYAAGEKARRLATDASIAIGYSDANELMRLEPVLDRLRRENDGLTVQLSQGPRDANVTRLAREQLDVVMGFEAAAPLSNGIVFHRLIEDGLSCIVPSQSPLAKLDEVGKEDVSSLPQVLCIPPGLRRRGYSAQSSIPASNGSTLRCSTSSEAYCLVDAGFGYALVPSLYTMPDPYHKVLRWKGSTHVHYGFYALDGSRDELVTSFARIAGELYATPDYDRPLPETWRAPSSL